MLNDMKDIWFTLHICKILWVLLKKTHLCSVAHVDWFLSVKGVEKQDLQSVLLKLNFIHDISRKIRWFRTMKLMNVFCYVTWHAMRGPLETWFCWIHSFCQYAGLNQVKDQPLVLLRGIRSCVSPASRTDLGCLFSLLTPCLSSYYFAFFCLFSSTSFPAFSIHSLLIPSVILFVSLCPWDPGTRWLKRTNDSDTNLLSQGWLIELHKPDWIIAHLWLSGNIFRYQSCPCFPPCLRRDFLLFTAMTG